MKSWGYWKAAMLIATLVLAGCAAEDDEGEESREVETSGGGGGGNCGGSYTEMLSASEREAANACGTQVSSQFAAADSYYQATLELCAEGAVTEADETYSAYQQQVDYARSVAEGFDCTSSGGDGGGTDDGGGTSVEDTSDETYYNLCVGRDDEYIYGRCYGPVQYADNTCPGSDGVSFNLINTYRSSSACLNARDDYLSDYQ